MMLYNDSVKLFQKRGGGGWSFFFQQDASGIAGAYGMKRFGCFGMAWYFRIPLPEISRNTLWLWLT